MVRIVMRWFDSSRFPLPPPPKKTTLFFIFFDLWGGKEEKREMNRSVGGKILLFEDEQ